jgi:hypothetical protein
VRVNQQFGGTYNLHLQGQRVSEQEISMKQAVSRALLAACFTLVCYLAILLPSLCNKDSLSVQIETVCLNNQSTMKMVKVFTAMISEFSDEVACLKNDTILKLQIKVNKFVTMVY